MPTSNEVKTLPSAVLLKIRTKAIGKIGRKLLGDKKRKHAITLRFNAKELDKVRTLLRFYNVDFDKRGAVGPFLRLLIINKETEKAECLPDSTTKVGYQLNKIGTNINQLVKVVHYKNRRTLVAVATERDRQAHARMLRAGWNALDTLLGSTTSKEEELYHGFKDEFTNYSKYKRN